MRVVVLSLVGFVALALAACAAHSIPPIELKAPENLQLSDRQKFLMRPVLQPARIFMRRIEDPALTAERATHRQLAAAGKTPRAVKALPPHQWIDLADYKVSVHAENQPLQLMVENILQEAEPFTGPWKVEWKLNPDNTSILDERFSLNTETTFAEFSAYLSNFVLNYRGFELKFSVFKHERILVISEKGAA